MFRQCIGPLRDVAGAEEHDVITVLGVGRNQVRDIIRLFQGTTLR